MLVTVCTCRFVFALPGDLGILNRAMPASTHEITSLSKDFFRRYGLPPKGPRSWRRLLVNTPMALAGGRLGEVQGLAAVLQRMGAWTSADMHRSAIYEVYVSVTTDMMGADVTRINSGRQEASPHRQAVRMHGLLNITSEVVSAPGERHALLATSCSTLPQRAD